MSRRVTGNAVDSLSSWLVMSGAYFSIATADFSSKVSWRGTKLLVVKRMPSCLWLSVVGDDEHIAVVDSLFAYTTNACQQ